jgi:hypothetical protein
MIRMKIMLSVCVARAIYLKDMSGAVDDSQTIRRDFTTPLPPPDFDKIEDLYAGQQSLPPEILCSDDDLHVKVVNPRTPHCIPLEVLTPDGRAVHPLVLAKLDPVSD